MKYCPERGQIALPTFEQSNGWDSNLSLLRKIALGQFSIFPFPLQMASQRRIMQRRFEHSDVYERTVLLERDMEPDLAPARTARLMVLAIVIVVGRPIRVGNRHHGWVSRAEQPQTLFHIPVVVREISQQCNPASCQYERLNCKRLSVRVDKHRHVEQLFVQRGLVQFRT